MPLVDTDMVLAYLKEVDHHQKDAEHLFQKILTGKLEAYISTSLFVELAFVLKRFDSIDVIPEANSVFHRMPHLSIIPLSENIINDAAELMKKDIGVLDSLHAATALNYDKKIISSDHIFDKVEGLQRIKPEDI